jgi:hypothetical protein
VDHPTKGCECRTPVCDSQSDLRPRNERSGGCHKATKQAEIAGQCCDLLFRFQVSHLNSSSEEMAGCATAFGLHILTATVIGRDDYQMPQRITWAGCYKAELAGKRTPGICAIILLPKPLNR